MSTPFNDANLSLDVAVRLASIGFMLSSLEQISIKSSAFGATGPFSEAIASVYGRGISQNRVLKVAFSAALYTNVLAGLGLVLFGALHALSFPLLLLAVLGNLVVRRRRITASDGAEQMTMLIMVAALLASVPFGDSETIKVAVWFIGAQGVLSYTSAGIAKMFSQVWRSGTALSTILGSEAHGHKYVSEVFTKYPALGKAMTWFVVLFECSFWLSLVGPPPLTAALLVIAFGFHVGCAIFMGLNSFVWAFPATYMCVWYIAQTLGSWLA